MGRRAERAAKQRAATNGSGLQEERLRNRNANRQRPVAHNRAQPPGLHQLDIRVGATYTDLPLWVPWSRDDADGHTPPADWRVRVIPREPDWGPWYFGSTIGNASVEFYLGAEFVVSPEWDFQRRDPQRLVDWVESFDGALSYVIAPTVWSRYSVARERVLGWTEPGLGSFTLKVEDETIAQAKREGFAWPGSAPGELVSVRYPHQALVPVPEWRKGSVSFTIDECSLGRDDCLMEIVSTVSDGSVPGDTVPLAHIYIGAKGWSLEKTEWAEHGTGAVIKAMKTNLAILNDDVLHSYAKHQAELLMGTTDLEAVQADITSHFELYDRFRKEKAEAYARRVESRTKTLEARRRKAAATGHNLEQ